MALVRGERSISTCRHPGDGGAALGDAKHTIKPVVRDGPVGEMLGAGSSGGVTSHHRQAVTDAGSLRVAAVSEDGVIEAIERADAPFFVGVQWHPERTLERALGLGCLSGWCGKRTRIAGDRRLAPLGSDDVNWGHGFNDACEVFSSTGSCATGAAALQRTCSTWQAEAAMRMLMNNLDPEVAERPEDLIVYGGRGQAARSWEAFDAIVATLKRLKPDETLLVQSASRWAWCGRRRTRRGC